MGCDLRVMGLEQTLSSPTCFLSWYFITITETLTMTQFGGRGCLGGAREVEGVNLIIKIYMFSFVKIRRINEYIIKHRSRSLLKWATGKGRLTLSGALPYQLWDIYESGHSGRVF